MKILIDTNILLDVIVKREPYFTDSEKIISMCVENKINGCIASHSVINIFYILRKSHTSKERRKILLDLCKIFDVINIDKHKMINALENERFDDMEDCLQSECANSYQANYIITRNVKDFSESKILAIEPKKFIELLF